jgi:hypothetical protein
MKMKLLNADLEKPIPVIVDVPDAVAGDFADAVYLCEDPCDYMDAYDDA